MAERKLKIYMDTYVLSASFSDKPGYMVETGDDRVMVKVAEDGEVIGFEVTPLNTIEGEPVSVELRVPENA